MILSLSLSLSLPLSLSSSLSTHPPIASSQAIPDFSMLYKEKVVMDVAGPGQSYGSLVTQQQREL